MKLAARSGDFFSAGSSVSCCHRALPLSATVFIQATLYPPLWPGQAPAHERPRDRQSTSGRRRRGAGSARALSPTRSAAVPAALAVAVGPRLTRRGGPRYAGPFRPVDTRSVMAATHGSIFDAMLQEFDGAARILNLEPGIWKILTHPKRQITVVLPDPDGQRRDRGLHRLSRAVQHHARAGEGRHPLSPRRHARRSDRAGGVDDVEVRRRAHPVRRRQGRRHLRSDARCRSARSKR